MKQEIAEIWVRALRSGNYNQGTLKLAQDKGQGINYCCLGVLCDLAMQNGEQIKVRQEVDSGVFLFNGASAFLPETVKTWAGLKTEEAALREFDGGTKLSILNDQGKTFLEIADIIENNWEKL
jgi:hypothetical protein